MRGLVVGGFEGIGCEGRDRELVLDCGGVRGGLEVVEEVSR